MDLRDFTSWPSLGSAFPANSLPPSNASNKPKPNKHPALLGFEGFPGMWDFQFLRKSSTISSKLGHVVLCSLISLSLPGTLYIHYSLSQLEYLFTHRSPHCKCHLPLSIPHTVTQCFIQNPDLKTRLALCIRGRPSLEHVHAFLRPGFCLKSLCLHPLGLPKLTSWCDFADLSSDLGAPFSVPQHPVHSSALAIITLCS